MRLIRGPATALAVLAALAGAALALAAWPRSLGAEAYEVFIDIETEEDLYELLAEGQIGEDTFDALVALYQRGVDLDVATRDELYGLPNLTYADVDAILAYRKEAGRIGDPAALVTAEVIGERKLLAIAPFLIYSERRPSGLPIDGKVRVGSRWTAEDGRIPPMMLQARATALAGLTAGVSAVLTRDRLGDVVYDPNRGALSAEPPGSRLQLPKFFALWRSDDFTAVVGTYRIGFGQRLTFDNTRQLQPNGIQGDVELTYDLDLTRACKESRGELAESPCQGPAGEVYVTPDWGWADGLLGVAAGLQRIPMPVGHMQAYGFASYQPRSIYQYEIYDRGQCDDPQRDDDAACSAPQVFRQGDDVLMPTSRFSYYTLPDLYAETTVGGNATFYAQRRLHVGVTGYTSRVDWLPEGIDLDFQEWSRRPYGGPFGAVGVDAAWGHRWLDVFAEVSHSFDSMPASASAAGGGGPAAVVQATATQGKREVEASLRYLDTDFANPYARPISAADEFDGLRARDEVGGRLRFRDRLLDRLDLRASADLWRQPSVGAWKTDLYLRTDVEATRQIGLGIWGEFRDKDLGRGGRGQCFEIPVEDDERGEPIPCAGQRVKLTGRVRFTPSRRYAFAGQYDHSWTDDAREDRTYRQDISAWLSATVKPLDPLRARVRVRYRFEDISDNTSLEQSLWTYLDLYYRLAEKHRIRLRYDLRWWLDDRPTTLVRVPSPEHWLWLEVESRF